jgi:chemotaxis protein methyltransferase CheR
VKGHADLDEGTVSRLTALAASWSGFTRDAIHVDAVRRAARECIASHMTTKELLERAAAHDPAIVELFRQAICVGETYFFRSPEHFSFLMQRVLLPRVLAGTKSLRAWSAACSTGEEAYSMAASLLAAAPAASGIELEVLGTDLSPESLRRARLGEYRSWSVRDTAPIPVPLFHRSSEGRIRVNDDVKAITKFVTHDLLRPPPSSFGEFDVIFCRNVLVYFDAPSIRLATQHLASRLLPGGIILFGVLEVDEPPAGLVSVGGPSLTAFERPLVHVPAVPSRRPKAHAAPRPFTKVPKKPSWRPEARRSAAPKRRMTVPPAAKPLPSDIRSRHIDALHLIEKNQKRQALDLLAQIQRQAPSYVAALLDQALLHQKSGQPKLATQLMQQILRLTESVPVDTMLPGLEELPVAYYRAAAESFLRGTRKES